MRGRIRISTVLIALLAMAVTFVGYQMRYDLFPNWSPGPSGKLSFEEDLVMSDKINMFFEVRLSALREERLQGYHDADDKIESVCGHDFWGRDDKYIYVDLVCGAFKPGKDGALDTIRGSRVPTRVEVDKDGKILGYDQPVDGRLYPASRNWLFPKEIRDIADKRETKAPWNNIHLKAYERQKPPPKEEQ